MLFVLFIFGLLDKSVFFWKKLILHKSNKYPFFDNASLVFPLVFMVILGPILVSFKLGVKLPNVLLFFRMFTIKYFVFHSGSSLIEISCPLVNNVVLKSIFLVYSWSSCFVPDFKSVLVVFSQVLFSPLIKLLKSFPFNFIIFCKFFSFNLNSGLLLKRLLILFKVVVHLSFRKKFLSMLFFL